MLCCDVITKDKDNLYLKIKMPINANNLVNDNQILLGFAFYNRDERAMTQTTFETDFFSLFTLRIFLNRQISQAFVRFCNKEKNKSMQNVAAATLLLV